LTKVEAIRNIRLVPNGTQRGAVVQSVRIPACHAGGRGFESRPFRHYSLMNMSSERDLVNFLGDFSMDVAKAVIAGGVATAIGSLASFACVSFGFPVILVGGAILLTGIVCTVVLNEIDAQCHLSEKLKYAIRDGLKRQQELDKWKRENMTPFMYVLNTPPVI
jgi:hypothetical protein